MLLGWALAAWIIGSFASTVAGDLLLRFGAGIQSQEARYYALHALVNLIVVILIIPDIMRFLLPIRWRASRANTRTGRSQ